MVHHTTMAQILGVWWFISTPWGSRSSTMATSPGGNCFVTCQQPWTSVSLTRCWSVKDAMDGHGFNMGQWCLMSKMIYSDWMIGFHWLNDGSRWLSVIDYVTLARFLILSGTCKMSSAWKCPFLVWWVLVLDGHLQEVTAAITLRFRPPKSRQKSPVHAMSMADLSVPFRMPGGKHSGRLPGWQRTLTAGDVSWCFWGPWQEVNNSGN